MLKPQALELSEPVQIKHIQSHTSEHLVAFQVSAKLAPRLPPRAAHTKELPKTRTRARKLMFFARGHKFVVCSFYLASVWSSAPVKQRLQAGWSINGLGLP
ncbi:hypothetical protein BaRGS_00011762 [Batillaria attramentaria]|uniref:Uncharacterized protein n=1 Tax=Batillaria attramentaria TaxID=370345 RepID=A0ABD0LD09_9CAEN